MTLAATVETARTLLFVPGDRPERFARAGAAGADLVVLDLEDAVAPAAKPDARAHVAAWLAEHRAAVRVNPVDSPWFAADLDAVAARPRVVMVPKAESAGELADLAARLPDGSAVVALVETARGVLAARALAEVPAVVRLAFGSYDLAAELGVSPDDPTAMAAARGALVLASAAAGIAPPVDGVTGDVGDDEVLRADVVRAARLGMTAKLCIHPRQVPLVHDALAPAPAEIAWARAVLAAAAEGGVTVVDGRMVDKPVVDRARRLLARLGTATS